MYVHMISKYKEVQCGLYEYAIAKCILSQNIYSTRQKELMLYNITLKTYVVRILELPP